jgi:hypothetical protein
MKVTPLRFTIRLRPEREFSNVFQVLTNSWTQGPAIRPSMFKVTELVSSLTVIFTKGELPFWELPAAGLL